jgi:polyisoprenyl-teichoic acid--peptidoglycan teichoic acid transferase
MLLLAVLVVAVVGGVLLGMRAAAFNATVTDTPFVSTQLLWPLNGQNRVNVMMVGYGGADHDGAYLADSIQVLSIDPTTDTTTTIPIPRDLWIEGVGSFPQNARSRARSTTVPRRSRRWSPRSPGSRSRTG